MVCVPYHSPKVGQLLDKVRLWDGTEPFVARRRDGGHAQGPHALLQELRHDEAVVAAANLQESDGEAVDVHLRVVRLARQDLGGSVYLLCIFGSNAL